MTSPATKTCDKCAGAGTMPREVRKLEDGETVDPLDTRRSQLCDRCGGSGVVRQDYAGVTDKAAGFIADQI